MLDEADGPMNFTQMVTLFASKMAGGTDDDETILKSFEVRSMQILSPWLRDKVDCGIGLRSTVAEGTVKWSGVNSRIGSHTSCFSLNADSALLYFAHGGTKKMRLLSQWKFVQESPVKKDWVTGLLHPPPFLQGVFRSNLIFNADISYWSPLLFSPRLQPFIG